MKRGQGLVQTRSENCSPALDENKYNGLQLDIVPRVTDRGTLILRIMSSSILSP